MNTSGNLQSYLEALWGFIVQLFHGISIISMYLQEEWKRVYPDLNLHCFQIWMYGASAFTVLKSQYNLTLSLLAGNFVIC